jgi:hypothetical protein
MQILGRVDKIAATSSPNRMGKSLMNSAICGQLRSQIQPAHFTTLLLHKPITTTCSCIFWPCLLWFNITRMKISRTRRRSKNATITFALLSENIKASTAPTAAAFSAQRPPTQSSYSLHLSNASQTYPPSSGSPSPHSLSPTPPSTHSS